MIVRMEAVSGIHATHVFTAAVTRDFPLANDDGVILRHSVPSLQTLSATVLQVTDSRTTVVSHLMENVQYVLTDATTTAKTMATALTTLICPMLRFVHVLAYLQGRSATLPVTRVVLKEQVSTCLFCF